MKWIENNSLRRAAVWGAANCALFGLVVSIVPGVSGWLRAVSFDCGFLARQTTSVPEVVVVAMDEESHSRLAQRADRLWDRSLHVKLLDTLLIRGARAVVFDVLFTDEWPDRDVDVRFAQALERGKGKVLLAASLRSFEERGEVAGGRKLTPTSRLADAAPWGVIETSREPDGFLRRHPFFPEHTEHTALALKAAEVIGVAPPGPGGNRWLNDYGPGAFRKVSYWQALQPEQPPLDIFSNKVIFIGQTSLITPKGATLGDEYPTPRTRWTGDLLSGVEIQATGFANLWRRDWLQELPQYAETGLYLICGVLFGFGLALVRPLPALALAAVGSVLVATGALALVSFQRLWFPWLIVAGVQVPFALGWSLLSFVLRALHAKDIPDHELLRCIGRGGYGEVWLARDAIGGFHAVKIVYRKNFPNSDPFEREFRGIQTFAPLSRSHPGLVHILHVGRNELRGCFYYVMEAADDENSGSKINPNQYLPRTLAADIARRGRLSASECVQLGLELTSALEHLHQRQLIHRDVKPANIIFVNGQPKLTDVGLVRTTSGEGEKVSLVGTSGFMAPEGPGSPQADIYALGKTLYEAATGWDCGRFPELPTELNPGPEADALVQLHHILLTACETSPAERYATAAAMRADLLDLQCHLAPSTAPAG